jgi:UDP-N-acetylmuramoyl-tripeptide--D-alanyl-D-alanine ligase
MFTLDEIIRATGGALVRRGSGRCADGVSIDSRSFRRGQLFVAIPGEIFDGHDFIPDVVRAGASCVVFERGRFPARGVQGDSALVSVRDSVRALSDIAHFHRKRFDMPVIAVTGSNGKTTTKDMCSWLLAGRYRLIATEGTKNNHIGVPLTLLRLTGAHQGCVLELGSNHFGEIGGLAETCVPTIGVITNVGPSHLEYFRSLAGVCREKLSLLAHLGKPAVAVVNADDPCFARTVIAKKRKPFIISIGINNAADLRARSVGSKNGRVTFSLGGRRFMLNTPGCHNVYNALAACAVAQVMGIGYREIAPRLARFEFPAGRLKLVSLAGAAFIDDSYNSSPASFSQALQSFAAFRSRGRRILVMGDMLELGSREADFHREAGRRAARVCSVLVAVGALSRLALEAFLDAGGEEAYACDSAAQAKKILFGKLSLTPHDAVLVKGSRRMKLDLVFK